MHTSVLPASFKSTDFLTYEEGRREMNDLEAEFPMVMRMAPLWPENIRDFEKHRKREGAHTGHVDRSRSGQKKAKRSCWPSLKRCHLLGQQNSGKALLHSAAEATDLQRTQEAAVDAAKWRESRSQVRYVLSYRSARPRHLKLRTNLETSAPHRRT